MGTWEKLLLCVMMVLYGKEGFQRGVQITDEKFEGGEWFRLNDIPQD